MTIPVNLFRLDKLMPDEGKTRRSEFHKLLHEKRPEGTTWCAFFHGSAKESWGGDLRVQAAEVLSALRPGHEPHAFFFSGQTLVDFGFLGATIARGITVIYI